MSRALPTSQDDRSSRLGREDGAGTVEYVALTALIAALVALGVGGALGSGGAEVRALGSRIGIKVRCAARLPEPCWRDPLTDAYGRPLAGLVRAWAPQPKAINGLVPVDPRRCRRASCAAAADERLTTSNRRITVFTRIADRRRRDGSIRVTYWEYRPTLGWAKATRIAGGDDVTAVAKTPLLESATPRLVPLESSWSLSREVARASSAATSGRSGIP